MPGVGPTLSALVAVKLYRPRGPRHFWLFQGLGLMQVGMGCGLTLSPAFGALVLAYLACLLAALALHDRRAVERAGVGGPADAPPLAFPSLRRALLAAAGGLLLFLLTPRADWASWGPAALFGGGPAPARTGFEETVNLNRTGLLEEDAEEAFRAQAADAQGAAKTDLPADQLWRGVVLERYARGRWTLLDYPRRPRPDGRLPEVGADRFFLDFRVPPAEAGGLFLAEPVVLGPAGARLPVLGVDDQPTAPFTEYYGTVLPMAPRRLPEHHYRQVVPVLPDAERLPAATLDPDYVLALRRGPPAPLPAWADDLLRRLADDPAYGLTRDDLAPPPDEGVPPNAERVARALTRYLTSSGEYSYTLDLQRSDRRLDPAADFLINVRAGHCERFAGALALLLRARGVPCRLVKGYRGAEHEGEGRYVVRKSFAHAWVEALVPARPRRWWRPPGAPYDWLRLDPTPEVDPASAPSELLLWWRGHSLAALWRDLIVGYGVGEQEALWRAVRPTLRRLALPGLALLAVPAVGLLLAAGARALRRRRGGAGGAPAGAGLYARLVALLERSGRPPPAPGQTPREHAAAAGAWLAGGAATAPLAGLPARLAEAHYRARFGGRAPSPDEAAALNAELAALAAALAAGDDP
jgi:hypothetical protein